MRRMTNYNNLNWKTEEKFNISSTYQPPVYHDVDNTGISYTIILWIRILSLIFFGEGGGSVDFSYKYDYLNICENKYT